MRVVPLAAGDPAFDESLPNGIGEAQEFVVAGVEIMVLGKTVFEITEKSAPDIRRRIAFMHELPRELAGTEGSLFFRRCIVLLHRVPFLISIPPAALQRAFKVSWNWQITWPA